MDSSNNIETIELKTYRSGTTVAFFTTAIEADHTSSYKAFVVLSDTNQPIHYQTYDTIPMWRDQNNDLIPLDSSGMNFVTGSLRTERLEYSLNDIDRNKISTNWQNYISLTYSGNQTSYVLFEDILLDDMFINVSLTRSHSTLDTLNIYNNLLNSFPVQESTTGTVFGKLKAIQKIQDRNGNNISIPLKNVPIGIFNPTESYPTPISTNENGNRMSLNLRESSSQNSYFNSHSFSADTFNFLQSGYEFDSVPGHYKYVTETNDEGEFVIHNVPIGAQTLFFEVDLFKQGLTYDEIALNFFPFPPDNDTNISNLPSLFFRQFQIDVIPTWGVIQTGYTEVNISVDLDLRKWATYFVEQISFNDLDLNSLRERGISTPMTIGIRNMGKDGYPINKLPIVEVPDMLLRNEDHVLVWGNEFAQLKSKAQFFEDGYHVFKLPANMYDPNGRKTDKNGDPIGTYGVWLAGYQLSIYFSDKETIFRNTGSIKYELDSQYVTRDHFNLNHNNVDMTTQNSSAQQGIGSFPYERKWDHVYPEPYRIPKTPRTINPYYDTISDQGIRILERPLFIDGDMIGKPFSSFVDSDNEYGGTGGYGVAYDETNGSWFKTDFSKFVTKNYIYRYENTNDPNAKYCNGYMPNDPEFPVQANESHVLNGERYQRVECGYGYWLKPEGWPRIIRYPENGGSDAVYPFDTRNPNGIIGVNSTNNPNQSIHTVRNYKTSTQFMSTIAGKKLFLNLGYETNIKEGGLDIYRIVDPSPTNINAYVPSITPTYTDYYFQNFYFQRGRSASRVYMGTSNGAGANHLFWGTESNGWNTSINEMSLSIKNVGVISVDIAGRRIAPGSSATFFGAELSDTSSTFEGMVLRLEANYNFDYNNFRYRETKYEFTFRNIKLYNADAGLFAGQAQQEGPTHDRTLFINNLLAGPESSVPKCYLRSYLLNVNTACGRMTVQLNGIAFPNPDQGGGRGDPFYGARFMPQPVIVTCPFGIPTRDDSLG